MKNNFIYLLLIFLLTKTPVFGIEDSTSVAYWTKNFVKQIVSNEKNAKKNYILKNSNLINLNPTVDIANNFASEYVNGGTTMVLPTNLPTLLSNFNASYAPNDLKIYVFVGRYFMGYTHTPLGEMVVAIKNDPLREKFFKQVKGIVEEWKKTQVNAQLAADAIPERLLAELVKPANLPNLPKKLLFISLSKSYVLNGDAANANGGFQLRENTDVDAYYISPATGKIEYETRIPFEITLGNSPTEAEYTTQVNMLVQQAVSFLTESKTDNLLKYLKGRELAYAYLLKKNAFDHTKVKGFNELKPNGFMYNWNAAYNAYNPVKPVSRIFKSYYFDETLQAGVSLRLSANQLGDSFDETTPTIRNALGNHFFASLNWSNNPNALKNVLSQTLIYATTLDAYLPSSSLKTTLRAKLDALIVAFEAYQGADATYTSKLAKIKIDIQQARLAPTPVGVTIGVGSGGALGIVFILKPFVEGFMSQLSTANQQSAILEATYGVLEVLKEARDIVDFDEVNASLQTTDELNLWNVENKIRNGQTITDAEWDEFVRLMCSLKRECFDLTFWKKYTQERQAGKIYLTFAQRWATFEGYVDSLIPSQLPPTAEGTLKLLDDACKMFDKQRDILDDNRPFLITGRDGKNVDRDTYKTEGKIVVFQNGTGNYVMIFSNGGFEIYRSNQLFLNRKK